MEKAINERIEQFTQGFLDSVKRVVDEDEEQEIDETLLHQAIEDKDKKIFLINVENFENLMTDIKGTFEYNFSKANKRFNAVREFHKFADNFLTMVKEDREVTNQINTTYRNFNNGPAEEEEEESEEEDFDDEADFVKVYSNRPRKEKIGKGETPNIQMNPVNFGFDSLFFDSKGARKSLFNRLKQLEERHKTILMKNNYFGDQNEMIDDVYRVGRVVILENQVRYNDFKNILFEQLFEDTVVSRQVSFERIEKGFLFSGQLMVIKTMTTDNKIEVLEILKEENPVFNEPTKDNCNALLVKGPFFSPRKIDLEGLVSKIQRIVQKTKTNVLIVKGPIIHNKYRKETKNTFEEIQLFFFETLNKIPVDEICYINESSEIDNISFLPINPMDSVGRIKMLPNPCQLSLGGFNIAFSSEDLLSRMQKDSFFFGKLEEEDKLDMVLEGLHGSRSLLPLLSPEINYDEGKSQELSLNTAPDVFILNSQSEKSFVRKVDRTSYINVKRFVDSNMFGAYCFLNIKAGKNVVVELFECEEE